MELCATADHYIKLLVTSSIGVANLWDPAYGAVPEKPFDDPSVAATSGYAASKYVIEKASCYHLYFLSLRS